MTRPLWKTQDGRTIPLDCMTDSHLENAIRYLECRGMASVVRMQELGNPSAAPDNEEDKIAWAEAHICQLSRYLRKIYPHLLYERAKRDARTRKELGLDPKERAGSSGGDPRV